MYVGDAGDGERAQGPVAPQQMAQIAIGHKKIACKRQIVHAPGEHGIFFVDSQIVRSGEQQ